MCDCNNEVYQFCEDCIEQYDQQVSAEQADYQVRSQCQSALHTGNIETQEMNRARNIDWVLRSPLPNHIVQHLPLH